MEQNEAIIRALAISDENKMVFPRAKHPWTNEAAIVDMICPCRNEDDYALVGQRLSKNSERKRSSRAVTANRGD